MKIIKLLLVGCLLSTLTACGFHLPNNQNRLGNSLVQINVYGDYHSAFYKKIVQKLQVRGVKVNFQGTSNRIYKDDKTVPSLSITNPSVEEAIASLNSRASTSEYEYIVKARSVLKIPNHRPIVMRNGVSRTIAFKADHALASTVEKEIVKEECFEVLANQIVERINYLGKQSSPDEPRTVPAELLLSKDENNNDIYIDNSPTMTLLDALQRQDIIEENLDNKSVTIDELNNGTKILDTQNYELPKVAPRIVHEAPDSVSEEGFTNKE